MIWNTSLAFKWFVLCVIIRILLHIALRIATWYRLSFSEIKLFVSKAEMIIIILTGIEIIIGALCLLWCGLSWLMS